MTRVRYRLRPAVMIVVLAGIGVVLALWALFEARAQRAETADALAAQARVVATTLGPSLAAAAAATRELDELLSGKMLDSARLIGRLYDAGALSDAGLAEIVDRNDLDSVAVMNATGRLGREAGEEIPPDVLAQVGEALAEGADEVILDPASEGGVEHLTVASNTDAGGVVVVRIHSTTGRTFAGQLGVENLLRSLVGSEGVLYLGFREEPGGVRHEASWDAGPVPSDFDTGSRLRKVRERTAFEIEVPVASPAGTTAWLQVGLDGAPLERAVASATRRTALVGVVLVAFSLSITAIALTSRWRAIEREEAAERLAEAETTRRRSERLAAAGALSAGLAHEVRSPLNAIVLAAQRIERQASQKDCREFAAAIRSEVTRLEAILRQFLELARPVGDERRPTELRDVAEEVRHLLLAEAQERGTSIEQVQGAGAAVVDRNSIRRSLINLVHNAMEAGPHRGKIELVLREEEGGVGIHVLDRGSGIDEAEAHRLFDAFVSTRAEGTGLGLALVRRVAEEHGGSCRLLNRAGGGAEAVLWLPTNERGDRSA